MQNVVDDPAGSHEARIYCPTNNTAQGVPRSVVKPVPEFLGRCEAIKLRMASKIHT